VLADSRRPQERKKKTGIKKGQKSAAMEKEIKLKLIFTIFIKKPLKYF